MHDASDSPAALPPPSQGGSQPRQNLLEEAGSMNGGQNMKTGITHENHLFDHRADLNEKENLPELHRRVKK